MVKKGFTIIEVAIVLVVLSIVIMISFAGVGTMMTTADEIGKKQKTDVAAEQVKAFLATYKRFPTRDEFNSFSNENNEMDYVVSPDFSNLGYAFDYCKASVTEKSDLTVKGVSRDPNALSYAFYVGYKNPGGTYNYINALSILELYSIIHCSF